MELLPLCFSVVFPRFVRPSFCVRKIFTLPIVIPIPIRTVKVKVKKFLILSVCFCFFQFSSVSVYTHVVGVY